jgi:hypothetical protein
MESAQRLVVLQLMIARTENSMALSTIWRLACSPQPVSSTLSPSSVAQILENVAEEYGRPVFRSFKRRLHPCWKQHQPVVALHMLALSME